MSGTEENKVMDFVNEQFKQVNKKLDELTELTKQTYLQEYRLNRIEKQMENMQKSRKDSIYRILTPIISSVVSAIVAFVIAGGLKVN